MTYDEKLDKIVDKLAEERKMTRKGLATRVQFDQHSFTKIDLRDIEKIIGQLEHDEKILKLYDVDLPENTSFPSRIYVELKDTFDEWRSRYKLKQKSRIENLSDRNFRKVYEVLNKIENELQFQQSDNISLKFISSVYEIEGWEHSDIQELIDSYTRVLDYLKTIGVIKEYSHGELLTMSMTNSTSHSVRKYPN